ncbi:hypothetical protein FRC07_003906 [Ceratobasidium sp. 392]|nr:hypothetical protein FRC07_003906 [Ceratobasidium sp. 392]
MPPKRKNSSDSSSELLVKKVAKESGKAPPNTKAKVRTKMSSLPPKSRPPKWDKLEYSNETPTGEWSKKSLIYETIAFCPPTTLRSVKLNGRLTICKERFALDQVNSIGSDESRIIEAKELCTDVWDFLRCASRDIASEIYGSVLDDGLQIQIGKTMLGSLYFTELSGCDGDSGSARDVTTMSRLYSPLGLGTSIDLWYSYYVRMDISSSDERIGSLDVRANTINDCDPKRPRKCRAVELTPGSIQKKAPDALSVFYRSESSSSGTIEANIKSFERPLFGCERWLSPRQLFNILLAAAGVMYFNEDDTETPESTLARLTFFVGEAYGRFMFEEEFAKLDELEEEADKKEKCVPQRLLLLAREESDAEDSDDEEYIDD